MPLDLPAPARPRRSDGKWPANSGPRRRFQATSTNFHDRQKKCIRRRPRSGRTRNGTHHPINRPCASHADHAPASRLLTTSWRSQSSPRCERRAWGQDKAVHDLCSGDCSGGPDSTALMVGAVAASPRATDREGGERRSSACAKPSAREAQQVVAVATQLGLSRSPSGSRFAHSIDPERGADRTV